MKYIRACKSSHFIPIFPALLLSLLIIVQNSQCIPYLLNNEDESNLRNNINVTLQKCPWSNISQTYLKLEASFLFESNSSSSYGIFRLTDGEPNCSNKGWYRFKIFYEKNASESEYLRNGTGRHSEEIIGNYSWILPEQIALEDDVPSEEHSFSIHHEGILIAKFGKLKHVYREISDYCVEEVTPFQVVFSICHNICDERPCIPKCCPLNEVINIRETEPGKGNAYECQNSGVLRWKPKLHNDTDSSDPLSEIEHSEIKPHLYYHNRTNDISCHTKFSFIHKNVSTEIEGGEDVFSKCKIFHEESFRILRNGSLFVTEDNGATYLIDQSEFCIDGIQNFGKEATYSGDHLKDLIFMECQEKIETLNVPQEMKDAEVYIIIYQIIVPISSLFLVLTIIVYIMVWDLHNIHGHILFSYVCSLLGFYVCLFLQQFLKLNTTACTVTGAGIHFFFLMTACWLTIINVDIFWTFSKKIKVRRTSQNKFRKYLGYASFSIGMPFLIVSISFTLNEVYKDLDAENAPLIIPEYGKTICALSNESIGYYLYTPIGILLCFNIVLFIWTITTLVQHQISLRAALKDSSINKEDQSLRVFIKIFVVTGSTWIFEIIGWAIMAKTQNHPVAFVVFRILDICNLLLPIPIFFIFVWKQNIFQRLWQKYPCLRRILSICILGACCKTPQNDKRNQSFISGMTMSTKTLSSRKTSGLSVNDLANNRESNC